MANHTTEELEALQAVVDRVSSYQDGAPDGTVEAELRKALDEAGIDLPDDEVGTLASAIEEHGGQVEAAQVLG